MVRDGTAKCALPSIFCCAVDQKVEERPVAIPCQVGPVDQTETPRVVKGESDPEALHKRRLRRGPLVICGPDVDALTNSRVDVVCRAFFQGDGMSKDTAMVITDDDDDDANTNGDDADGGDADGDNCFCCFTLVVKQVIFGCFIDSFYLLDGVFVDFVGVKNMLIT